MFFLWCVDLGLICNVVRINFVVFFCWMQMLLSVFEIYLVAHVCLPQLVFVLLLWYNLPVVWAIFFSRCVCACVCVLVLLLFAWTGLVYWVCVGGFVVFCLRHVVVCLNAGLLKCVCVCWCVGLVCLFANDLFLHFWKCVVGFIFESFVFIHYFFVW